MHDFAVICRRQQQPVVENCSFHVLSNWLQK